MEKGITIKELHDAVQLHDDDFLPISQDIYNPITQKNGVARKTSIAKLTDKIVLETNRHADMVDGAGRDLMKVLLGHGIEEMTTQSLRNEAVAEVTDKILVRGEQGFRGIEIGDYVDGLDLSGIPGQASGTHPAAWNDTYKNNRFEVAGFNLYKGIGSTENSRNHVVMAFRNCIGSCRMNATADNTGGYAGSELIGWLEGNFLTALEQRLGITLGTLSLAHSTKGGYGWRNYKIWIPTEPELFGFQTFGDELNQHNTNCQFPIHQKSYHRRNKRLNGNRTSIWTSTPHADSTTYFVHVYSVGDVSINVANVSYGLSPVFCIAG